jgi:predicted nucleotidyltransferase
MKENMMNNVRLSDFYLETITQEFKNNFGADDHLWIFGSRVELHKKGGDIDLYIETNEKAEKAFDMKTKFITELWKKLGMQKIDVVINVAPFEFNIPIYDVAKKNGVLLV